MIEGLTPVNITEFDGLFSNGPVENIPKGHSRTAHNLRYVTGGVETRWGTSVSIAHPTGVRRWFSYKIEGQVNRIIYLDITGKVFDSLYPNAPILDIPEMIDFSMVVFNDRAYLTPHNRRRGLPGQYVYLYQGGGLPARPAGGQRPLGFTLQVTSLGAGGGRLEVGTHLFAVAYETDSGFITGPGPEVFAQYESAGDEIIRLSNIASGPSYITRRHILATKTIPNYTGDQVAPELFFVEGVEITDPSITEVELSFYDSQLQRSADYLHDEMELIPAVLGLGSYQGSLVGWGAQVDDSTVYISKAGEPESISLIEGGLEIDRSEAGGIRNAVEVRGLLLIAKGTRFYSTHNTGDEPAYWGWVSLDRGVGAEVFSIASILDDEGSTVDRMIVGDRKGMLLFDGTFQNNLTVKIDDIWKRITKTSFNTVQITFDPINECLYAAVPLDGANSPNTILYGDVKRGLDPGNIRWSVWTFPYSPSSVGLDVNEVGDPVMKIGSINGGIYFLDPNATNDNGFAIPDPTWETHLVGGDDIAVTQFGGVRLLATGVGVLDIEVRGLHDTVILGPPSLTLGMSPGNFLQREFDVQSPYASVKFSVNSVDEKFKLTRVNVYHAPLWLELPA